MKICTKCKKEMKCIKTAKLAIWFKTHAYAGDEFECPECKATVLVCKNEPFEVEKNTCEIMEASRIVEMN